MQNNSIISNVKLYSNTHDYWATTNPILAKGTGTYSTDTQEVKIGNGTTSWNDLNIENIVKSVSNHASTHATGMRDAITPESIGVGNLGMRDLYILEPDVIPDVTIGKPGDLIFVKLEDLGG